MLSSLRFTSGDTRGTRPPPGFEPGYARAEDTKWYAYAPAAFTIGMDGIYNDIVSADSPIQYLIMRNFGNSSATIIDLHLLYTGDPKYSKTLFSHMKGQVIAPGQSYSTAFKFDDYSTVIEAKVSYVSEAGKKYSSVFHIHQMAFTDNAHAKSSPRSSDEALKIIAASFQDFLRSRL